MRAPPLLIALVFSAAAAAHSISDEFSSGFGGVPWGIELSDLIHTFPGGFQLFSTVPGGLAYALNIDDPVLGISRRGLYVLYGIGTDRKVDDIEIQIPYDQTAQIVSTITAKFGPPIGPEVKGIVTSYRWPTDQRMLLAVRTTHDGRYGLTTLSIRKFTSKTVAKPSGSKPS